MATRRSWLLGGIFLGILCLTFAAYAPVFHAKFVWDDDSWLTGNPAVLDPHGLHAIWTSVPRMQYYPLVFTTFWAGHRLFGLEPLGYHLVTVLLHALNAFLVGLILRSLRVPGAFWVAALFGVLSALKRSDEAIADFDRFLAFNPSHAPAYEAPAIAHEQRGEDAQAKDDLARAVELDPKSAVLRGERGYVLVRLKQYDAAAHLDPSLPITFVLRGGLYQLEDGDTHRACLDWQQACRLGDCKLYEAHCR